MVLEYLPYVPLILLVIYLIKNPDTAEHWGSIFARIFSHISKKAERHSVSADIQSKLSSYIKNYTVDGVLPYGLRFKWVDKGNFESFVEEGDVVVIMDYHQNNARNFVNAIIAYTAQGLFPKIKSYLPEELVVASELLVQEKIIREKRPDALEIFRKDVLPERTQSMSGVKQYKEKFDNMDKAGYFETIFLPELAHAGHRLQEFNESQCKAETSQFIGLLDYISTRETGDESRPLNYDGKVFHVWIVLIAKIGKIMALGTSPYVKRVNEAITKHYDSIYLMTRGDNEKFMDPVIKAVQETTTAILQWKKSFKSISGKKRRTYATVALFRA